jgi:hypothetical protein
MYQVRPSAAVAENKQIRAQARKKGQSNGDWLAQSTPGDPAGTILLVGGASPLNFRLRAAQAIIRRDLLPSFWSHAALVTGKDASGAWTLREISLEPPGGFGDVPASNGIQTGSSAAYDDPSLYPNLAVISVAVPDANLPEGDATLATSLERYVGILSRRRTALNLATGLVDWLGYAWGAAGSSNPLQRGVGLPSATFVENAFAGAGVELTPGLASEASCPEAIWQSVKWWHDFYESTATSTAGALTGRYVIGQPAAAAREAASVK